MLETKEILHSEKLPELTSILKKEASGQVKMRKTEDHLEGIKAFIEKEHNNLKVNKTKASRDIHRDVFYAAKS